MGKINRELPLEHLEAEKKAMRWLASKGFTLEEIQMFSWHDVAEFDKEIRVKREFFFIKYDSKSGELVSEKGEHKYTIQIDDGEVLNFFAHSRIYSYFCFPSRKPMSAWRREYGLNSLFSLCEIRDIIRGGQGCDQWTSVLTLPGGFGKIELSKENIEKAKTKEQAKEAALVK